MAQLRDRWYIVIDVVTGETIRERHDQVEVDESGHVPIGWPDDMRSPGTIWGFSTDSAEEALRVAQQEYRKGKR